MIHEMWKCYAKYKMLNKYKNIIDNKLKNKTFYQILKLQYKPILDPVLRVAFEKRKSQDPQNLSQRKEKQALQ